MAGYSGTPLPQKLGLKPGARFGPTGLVDNKVCAIDDVWSGLRFVYRIVDRPNVANVGRAAKR